MGKRIKASLIFLLFFCNASAQFEYNNFINFTQAEGLPSNETYYIFRDTKNFMWFATDQGVVRFDGKEMKRFNLPDNVVFKIREDKEGRIWFFTQTGKLYFLLSERIYPYKYNSYIQNQINTISITDAGFSDEGEILLNSYNGINYKIKNNGIIDKTNYLSSKSDSLVFVINEIRGGKLFAQKILDYGGFHDTLYIYYNSYKKKEFYKVPFHQRSSAYYGVATSKNAEAYFYNSNCLIKLTTNGKFLITKFPSDILDIKMNEENNLFAGLIRNGCYFVNNDLTKIKEISFLKDKSITSINIDYEKGTWFSTLENGVFFVPKSSIINFLPSISSVPVLRLCAVNDSILFAAKKDGLYIYEKNKIKLIYPQKYNFVTDLFKDEMNNIWIAGSNNQIYPPSTFGEVTKFKDIRFNKMFAVQSSSEIANINSNRYFLNQGSEYIFIDIDQLKKEDKYLKLTANFKFMPGKVFKDVKGEVYIGSLNNLYKINLKNNIPEPVNKSDHTFNSGVTCMRQLDDSIIAIGLRFGGIALLKGTTIIDIISERNGLINNAVKYLLHVKNQLWVATAAGISVVSFKGENFLNYAITNLGKSRGLSNLIIYQLISYKNNILAATNGGIIQINNPDSLINEKPAFLPFYINSINIDKKDTTFLNYISIPFKKNRVVLHYSAVSFTAPKDVEYYYRFSGRDSAWSETSGNELIFENLAPGDYYFELKAAIPKDQRFSEVRSIKFVIEKPWWQNNFLRIAAVILLLIITSGLYKWRMIKIRTKDFQKAELRLKMAEWEQTALRSQMNPHFIFNCLSSIQQLILFEKNQEANEYLLQFSKLIRSTLEISSRSFIPISEEKEYLSKYIILEQMRIPGQFDYEIIIEKNIDMKKIEIPSMIIQPIVENSIRHGMKNLINKKGMISISFEKNGKFISCTITDNGKGNDSGFFISSKRHGIRNVVQRLSILSNHYTETELFDIQNQKDAETNIIGTIVTLKMPFKEK